MNIRSLLFCILLSSLFQQLYSQNKDTLTLTVGSLTDKSKIKLTIGTRDTLSSIKDSLLLKDSSWTLKIIATKNPFKVKIQNIAGVLDPLIFTVTKDTCIKITKSKIETTTFEFGASFLIQIYQATATQKEIKSYNRLSLYPTQAPTQNNPPTVINRSRRHIIDSLKQTGRFKHPYDKINNTIYLYFDANGKLLNRLPVNVDQGDQFVMTIVCQQGDEDMYSINVTQGDYSPTDLSIAPHAAVTGLPLNTTSQNSLPNPETQYTTTPIEQGPFTSDKFEFQIAYDDTTKKVITHSQPYSIKINKLYQLGIGVSFVGTGLSNPTFKTVFNGTDTTIHAFNGGNRTLVIINAIWYWSVLQQKKEGSVITRGRDILKDEPTFSWTRVFPTVGVSLDNNFRQNYFLGAVYEFAHGGSIIAGLHYGQVNRLADKNFVLDKTHFSGADATIKVDQVYKSGFFIGVSLDTRILNILFGGGK